jgi:hypothetical protein
MPILNMCGGMSYSNTLYQARKQVNRQRHRQVQTGKNVKMFWITKDAMILRQRSWSLAILHTSNAMVQILATPGLKHIQQ